MADSVSKKRKLEDEKFTRSKHENSSTPFEWKTCCFICGEKTNAKKKGNMSLVQSGVNANGVMFAKVLRSAEEKKDNKMIARLSNINGDLVAVEARYHRQKSCYIKYIKAPQQINVEINQGHKAQIVQILKERFYENIEKGVIYELSTLRDAYEEISANTDTPSDVLDNRQFMALLELYWQDIHIIRRGHGRMPIVTSKNISKDDAIIKLFELSVSMNALNESFQNSFENNNNMNQNDNEDNIILHKAVAVLKRELSTIVKLEKEYYSSEEVSLEGQKKFANEAVLKFLCWLKNSIAFKEGTSIEADQKLVTLCCDIMSVTTGISSPKHLGLAIHLHHLYGSRKLIDDMYKLGYTVSYTELRQFLTAAAVHMSNKQQTTPSGSLVPSSVKAYTAGEPLLLAAGDNWDHNEATPDGKNTTHAMTSIVVVPRSRMREDVVRIVKTPSRTLSQEEMVGPGGLSSVMHYAKPKARPNPILQPPPRGKEEIRLQEPQSAKILKLKDLMYNCLKLGYFCDDRYEGTWTTFHANTMPDMLNEKSDVVYNPIILAQPTHYDTVYTTLKRCKEQMCALGQNYCPVVFDMGLLTKAVEILWARSNELCGVIPLDGGMHMLMCIFAGIGYIYGDLGLKALLSESDVFAPKTADHIIAGKDFDRGLRAFLMIDEVLNSLLLSNFRIWCDDNGHDIFSKNQYPLDQENATDFLCDKVIPLLDVFCAQGREASPTFAFWNDYLNNISTPFKLYLASSRHAVFDAFEYSRSLFLPFFFASNRTIYAKYMPYLVLEMRRLPQMVRQSFDSGYFMTKITKGMFNSVWLDYCLEVTENKTLKSNGGIIGLTHRDGALGRWFLARPVTAKYSSSFSDSDEVENTKHHTDNKSYKQTYNDSIKKMMALFENTFIDPFSLLDTPCNLVNIATGISVPAVTEISLLNCHKKGNAHLDTFVEERFVVSEGKTEPSRNFYDPITKMTGIKSVRKAKPNMSNNLPINGEELYIRLLAMNSFKKVPLHRVMSFENAPVPLSLFTDNGDMLSGKKADFLHRIEALVSQNVIDKLDRAHCLIVDGMAVIQMIPPNSSKCLYKDMASAFWTYIMYLGKYACSIHVIFDRYFSISTKSQARKRRGEILITNRTFKIQADMKIPDWKQALTESSFKCELTKFYALFLAEFCCDLLCEGKSVFVSGGIADKVLKVTSGYISFVPDLITQQEEADTIMLIHAKFASLQGSSTICIFSPDTDVLVLLIHHFNSIGATNLYFQTGRKSIHTNAMRYIPIHCIVSVLMSEQLDIILPLYCISGCDTTSYFFGVGKKSIFKILSKHYLEFKDISCLGNTPVLNREHIVACTKLVGFLYGDSKCTSLNALRTEKVLVNKNVKPRRLPPTDDSFVLHLQRCLLQILIWKNALVPCFKSPDVSDYGYIVDPSGFVSPRLMTQAAAAPELLSDVVCKCKDLCDDDCACESLQQPCTVACGCEAKFDIQLCCKNIYTSLQQ